MDGGLYIGTQHRRMCRNAAPVQRQASDAGSQGWFKFTVGSSRYEGTGDAEVSLPDLPSGDYLISVETPTGREIHPFMLVR